jgi:hypothetical protein
MQTPGVALVVFGVIALRVIDKRRATQPAGGLIDWRCLPGCATLSALVSTPVKEVSSWASCCAC